VETFPAAFDAYWQNEGTAFDDSVACAKWVSLGLDGIDVQVAFRRTRSSTRS
jgi:hypothetical protein